MKILYKPSNESVPYEDKLTISFTLFRNYMPLFMLKRKRTNRIAYTGFIKAEAN